MESSLPMSHYYGMVLLIQETMARQQNNGQTCCALAIVCSINHMARQGDIIRRGKAIIYLYKGCLF